MGCCERFLRKDPGVFELLGSSLSCDTTVLTAPISICAYGLPNSRGVRAQKKDGIEVPSFRGECVEPGGSEGSTSITHPNASLRVSFTNCQKKDRPSNDPSRRIKSLSPFDAYTGIRHYKKQEVFNHVGTQSALGTAFESLDCGDHHRGNPP